MKVDVKVGGAGYSGVPAVLIPLQAGGTARFCEVSDTTATAADVAAGKTFYDADGTLTTGTASGQGTAADDDIWTVIVEQSEHQTISYTAQNTMTDKGNGTYELGFKVDAKVVADTGYLPGIVSTSVDKKTKTVTVKATEATIKQTTGDLVEIGSLTSGPTSSDNITGYTLGTITGIPNGNQTHFKAVLFCPTGVSYSLFTIGDFAQARAWSNQNAYATTPVKAEVTGGTEYTLEWDENVNVDTDTKVWDDDLEHDKVTFYCCTEIKLTGDTTAMANAKLTITVYQDKGVMG